MKKRRKKGLILKNVVALNEEALYNQMNEKMRQEQRNLAKSISLTLARKNICLACAESCTGGLISSCLTDVPGISSHFAGGIVSYQTRIKREFLGLSEEEIAQEGVISAATARVMAKGIKKAFGVDCGLGITGLAGPQGQENKPVGRVHIAVFFREHYFERRFDFSGSRLSIKEKAATAALTLLLQVLDD